MPTAMPVDTNAALSAPTQLLVRLIRQQDFEAATTVLNELLTLRSPLTEPLPIYSNAALWSIRNGRKKDMLAWMRLCPGYIPGTKHLNTASSANSTTQARSIANNFRKCFMLLLDSYGDDLRLLQQASMIAVQKGMWGVLQATLAQILRFGTGRMENLNISNPELAWQYFHRLLLANQSQRGLKDESLRSAIWTATIELRSLYNLGVRTLTLAGRLDDAIHWAERSAEVDNIRSPLAKILMVEWFTENLLMEELVKAGSYHVEQARVLADKLASTPARLERHRVTNIDAVIERVNREAGLRAEENDYSQRPASTLDSAIHACLEQGDIIGAREHLFSVLRSATRTPSREGEFLLGSDFETPDTTFAHLPSARILSGLQDMAYKLGTIAVTSSLTETDMHQLPDNESQDPYSSRESLPAESFLRPIRARLSSVRGGQGLWETARLYGFVKKGKWKEASNFYTGKTGFKIPSGGISNELVSLALDQQALPPPEGREELDKAQSLRGKHWPSTHAINLMLKALVGLCVDAKDYTRLKKVYSMWKEASLPRTNSSEELDFEQWPPSQRPSSFTFDPFIRAFARLEVQNQFAAADAANSAKVDKQAWGSSQAVLDVVRDMTETFRVQPSISTWTIALECLAREGRERWHSTTDVLARAVGINTVSALSSEVTLAEPITAASPTFPPATLGTYTALIRALIRVSHKDGGSMVKQASAVRDDLLVRTLDLDVAVRSLASNKEEDESEFWHDLMTRWQAVQQVVVQRGEAERDRWSAAEVIRANQGRTVEALRELWLLECAQAENVESFESS